MSVELKKEIDVKMNLVWRVQKYDNTIIIILSKARDLHYLFLRNQNTNQLHFLYFLCSFESLFSKGNTTDSDKDVKDAITFCRNVIKSSFSPHITKLSVSIFVTLTGSSYLGIGADFGAPFHGNVIPPMPVASSSSVTRATSKQKGV